MKPRRCVAEAFFLCKRDLIWIKSRFEALAKYETLRMSVSQLEPRRWRRGGFFLLVVALLFDPAAALLRLAATHRRVRS